MPTKARTAAAKAKTTTAPKPKPATTAAPVADPGPELEYSTQEPGELASNDDVLAVLGERADGIPVAAGVLQDVDAGVAVDEDLARRNEDLLAESGALAADGLFYSRAPGEIASA